MRVIKVLIVIVIVFAGFSWMIGWFLGPDDLRKCGTMPADKSGCARADAIVAVSGGDTRARADEAVKIYKAGWAPVIIFSGAAKDKSGPSNAAVMRQIAIDSGVDPLDIIIENRSENTSENALATTDILKSRSVKSVIIVTSAYHARRATLEFRKRAPADIDIRSHPVAEDNQWSQWWWLTPSGWALAIPETVMSLILATGGVADR